MKKIICLLMACSVMQTTLHAQSWLSTGNTGTSSKSNFIGTKDNQALILRTNNAERLRISSNGKIGIGIAIPLQKLHVKGNINIDSGFALYMANNLVVNIDSSYGNTFLGNGVAFSNAGKYNTGTGFQALHSNITGTHNTANGYKVLYSNKTGYYNIGTGSYALYHNASGNQNIADGYEALYTNTTGSSNIAIGHFALGLNTTGSFNTAVGEQALFGNTTGTRNIANGNSALYSNTTGSFNVANGSQALYSNNTGWWNVANGYQALYSNTTGSANIATGFEALYSNTTGGWNTANGTSALHTNTTGIYNTANGAVALYYNTTGSYNSANGYEALWKNISGKENTATGSFALAFNTEGDFNTATGTLTLFNNTSGTLNAATGYQALYTNISGSYNAAYGAYSLKSNAIGNENTAYGAFALRNATGSDNTSIGYYSLYDNTSGEQNTAVGANALPYNADSWDNTALGYYAGWNGSGSSNGWNNTFLGSLTSATKADIYNSTAIGNNTPVSASNQVRIGNNFVTSIGGYVNWTNVSDGRVKKNIRENIPGLVFINKLKPVTYNLDLDAVERITQSPLPDEKDARLTGAIGQGKPRIQKTDQAAISARNAQQQIVYTGFVAQDVEKAAKELKYDFSGVDVAKSDKNLYGLRYSEFVVPLVKAVQELSKDNDDLRSTLSDVVAELAELKKQLTELKNTKPAPGTQLPPSDFARLEQNVPNPFNNATVIGYHIPSGASRASLTISNMKGQILKTISVNDRGTGKTNISAGEFAAGSYLYTLFIDGKKTCTKQMEHLKQ